MLAMLTAVRWQFTVTLSFISPVTSDAEHLFMGLSAVAPVLTIGVPSAWFLCSFDMSLWWVLLRTLCFYCCRCLLAHLVLSALASRLSKEPWLYALTLGGTLWDSWLKSACPLSRSLPPGLCSREAGALSFLSWRSLTVLRFQPGCCPVIPPLPWVHGCNSVDDLTFSCC